MENLPLALQDLEALEKKILAELREQRDKLKNFSLQLKAIQMVVEKFNPNPEEAAKLRRRIRRLERRLETTPNLSPKQEKVLIEKISKLRKQYREIAKIMRLQRKKERIEEEKQEIAKKLEEQKQKLDAIKKKIRLYKMLGRSPDLPEGYVGTLGDVGIFEKED